ncbi:hypothetical protein KY320_01510 [Candidatus Woesearchaeota archaeon]|nr:hypothetical protein [Candidatus Woesearchaeota archaeon]
MGKAYYPEIAKFSYKDEHVEFEIKFRVKLIKFKALICPKCNDWDRLRKEATITLYPPSMEVREIHEDMLCERCAVPLVESNKKLIKCYGDFTKIDHVRVKNVLDKYTIGLRWREYFSRFGKQIVCYPKDLERLYEGLGWIDSVKKERGEAEPPKWFTQANFEMAEEKITMEKLEQDLQDYENRKFLKEL